MLHSQAQSTKIINRPKKALVNNSATKLGKLTLSPPTIKPSAKRKNPIKAKLSAKKPIKKSVKKPANKIIAIHKKTASPISTSDLLLMQKFNRILDKFIPLLEPKADITKEVINKNKRSNDKYEYLTQYGTQILALFTPASGCIYLSRNFEKITGQTAEQLLGDRFFTLLAADSADKLRSMFCPISACAATEAKSQILRMKMQHADGKNYWYQFTIHTQAQQYVCLIENIHEHIQTQNTLQKARLEAELALRARSEFLANMSHELRTPLNAVIGFSQIMDEGVFGKIEIPQYAGYIRNIQESGHDLLAKIEDLLDISNIDAGRISLEREEVYVDDLVRQVMKSQSHHAKSAKVSLSYVPRGNVLLFVDRLKMQHILGHLLTNAIKFNRAGGEVTIEVGRDGKSGIRLCIHDNGVGIADLKCHDIRESLQQDNCWTAKNANSIGIGLALTKEFVALHGGNVEITSSAGIGTTIAIILPRDCIRITPARKIEQIKQLENG